MHEEVDQVEQRGRARAWRWRSIHCVVGFVITSALVCSVGCGSADEQVVQGADANSSGGNDGGATLDATADGGTSGNADVADSLTGDGGSGVDSQPTPTCPLAMITGLASATIPAQTTVKLSGLTSSDKGGKPAAKYRWTLTQPAHSMEVIGPKSTAPQITFTPRVIGSYSLCLKVWDQAGAPSCAVECVEITVVPKSAIHIELTWSTAGDKDPYDTGPGVGSDLNLHFTHELATGNDGDCDGQPDPWFHQPFDTYWYNPNPNWGSMNPTIADNPVLARQDSDGWGPEIITLDLPEGSVVDPMSYQIGVVHKFDAGFGDSVATVRVFIKGKLAYTSPPANLKVHALWHVGRLNWPNVDNNTQSPLAPVNGCQQSGDPCASTSPGKKWTSTGSACVTQCYPLANGASPCQQP